MPETRACKVCGKTYPLTTVHFAQVGMKRDIPSYRHVCRDCFNRHNRERRAKDRTRICSDCGKEYPLTLEYFGENYIHNGRVHLRHQCRDCINAKKRERRNGYPTPPRQERSTPPECYTVLAIDWHTMSLVKLEATVVEVVADISKLKTDDALNAIIRQQRELYPNILFAKNPAVKTEISE